MENLSFKEIMHQATLISPVSDEEYQRALNNRKPVSPRAGIECEKCGNHEYTFVVRDGERYTRWCECKQVRDNYLRIERSGLKKQMEHCTFASFQTPEPWQQTVKAMVMQFVKDANRGWLLLAGQSGCGKTHLCTAAAVKFLKAGADTRYMRWVDESIYLKAVVNDESEYNKKLNKLKTCKVLCIDDFLKTQKPTAADIKLAYDLLNYRYCDQDLITIISTEWGISDLMNIDEALGGRIYERTKKYRFEIEISKEKNWRLRA